MEKLGIECKQLMAKEIKEKLKENSNIFISSFGTMVVPEQEQLRRRLKEIDVSLFVVKNRIARQVFQQLNLETLGLIMQGLTAITTGGPDAVCVSKALVDFASRHENFKILGGYVDEQLLDLNLLKRLAAVVSKEVLLAQIIFGFKSPIQGLVTSLSATTRKFIVAIDKIREQKTEDREQKTD